MFFLLLSIYCLYCQHYASPIVSIWPQHWHNSKQNWKYEIWTEMREWVLMKLQIFVSISLHFFFLHFGRFSLLFLRLPLTGWCAQCTLTLSDIGNALLSYSTRFPSNALFHLSFWNAKQISFLPFLWFLGYGHIIGCITFYLLPLFAEQALRSIFNISHSDSVTWKHQYIKANIISV